MCGFTMRQIALISNLLFLIGANFFAYSEQSTLGFYVLAMALANCVYYIVKEKDMLPSTVGHSEKLNYLFVSQVLHVLAIVLLIAALALA